MPTRITTRLSTQMTTSEARVSAETSRAARWRRGRAIVLGGSLVVAGGGSLACGSDTTGPVVQSTAQLYWQVTLNHHAITLATIAPYDTIHLLATPRTLAGTPLPTTARAVYTTSDTILSVDSAGLLRVLANVPRTDIVVTVQLTEGKVTLVDTAYVNIVPQSSLASIPVMDSLIFRPVPGDSAIRSPITTTGDPGMQTFAPVVAQTAAGEVIPNVALRFASSDPLVVAFADPTMATVTAVSQGRVLLTAEATVYGKSITDSLWYTVGWPIETAIVYGGKQLAFTAPQLPNIFQQGASAIVNQGGLVVWVNNTWERPDDSLDVQFDDTTGVEGLPVDSTITVPATSLALTDLTFAAGEGGNIPAFGTTVPVPFGTGAFYNNSLANVRVRVFTRLGTYHWHSGHQGITGTVTVKSNTSLTSK